MRKNEPRVHHMLDLIGGMQPREKILMLQYATSFGLPVPRIIAQACREFLASHAEELHRAKERERRLDELLQA